MAGNVARRSDGKWRARYRDHLGREHSRHFRRKLDADRWLASVELAKAHGEWLDPARAKIAFGVWSDQWLDAQSQLRPSTRYRYGLILEHQILPYWSKVPLSNVGHADSVAWVARLTDLGYAPATIRQAHRVFSLVLDLAMRDGRLTRNPAKGVRLPRVVQQEKTFLTHGQVDQLAEACGDHGLIVRFLAYTGLRWGEFVALGVRNVDLLRRRVSVVESASEVSGEVIFGPTKTHQRRAVVLPGLLVEPLSQHLAGKHGDELVFTAPNGGVLRNSNFRHRVLDRAAASVDLAGLSPHDLRHTAASLAIAAGANVKVVQQMMGHASAAMTLDVYAGLFADDLDSVAESLDQAARAAIADQMRTRAVPPAVTPLRVVGENTAD